MRFLVILLLLKPLMVNAVCSDYEEQTLKKMYFHLTIYKSGDGCRFSSRTDNQEITYIYKGEARWNSMPDGVEKKWYEKNEKNDIDRLMSEHFNVNGKIQGLVTTYYRNGQKKSESIYINNLPNGIETIWSEKGEKISENVYRNGMLVKAGVVNNSAKSNSDNSQIEIAKQKCLKLGFKEKTEKFGICVLEFIN